MVSYHGRGNSDGIGGCLKKAVWNRINAPNGPSVQSKEQFVKVAQVSCLNITTICWSDELSSDIESKYSPNIWLQGSSAQNHIPYVTRLYHVRHVIRPTSEFEVGFHVAEISKLMKLTPNLNYYEMRLFDYESTDNKSDTNEGGKPLEFTSSSVRISSANAEKPLRSTKSAGSTSNSSANTGEIPYKFIDRGNSSSINYMKPYARLNHLMSLHKDATQVMKL
jgi:hypothetical protein